jgi:RNA recognition motif-containing protein
MFKDSNNSKLQLPQSRLKGIFISGLPAYTSKEKLTQLFSQFGKISHVRIFSKREKNGVKGFAKIKYDSVEEAQNALKSSKKLKYENKLMKLTELKPQSKLEKEWVVKKKLLAVYNLPYETSKNELFTFLKKSGVPIRKVMRMLKEKKSKSQLDSNRAQQPNSGSSCSSIVELSSFDESMIVALNFRKLILKRNVLTFECYKSKTKKQEAISEAAILVGSEPKANWCIFTDHSNGLYCPSKKQLNNCDFYSNTYLNRWSEPQPHSGLAFNKKIPENQLQGLTSIDRVNILVKMNQKVTNFHFDGGMSQKDHGPMNLSTFIRMNHYHQNLRLNRPSRINGITRHGFKSPWNNLE